MNFKTIAGPKEDLTTDTSNITEAIQEIRRICHKTPALSEAFFRSTDRIEQVLYALCQMAKDPKKAEVIAESGIVTLLSPLLTSTEGVRRYAVEILQSLSETPQGKEKAGTAIEHLVELLSSPNVREQELATFALALLVKNRTVCEVAIEKGMLAPITDFFCNSTNQNLQIQAGNIFFIYFQLENNQDRSSKTLTTIMPKLVAFLSQETRQQAAQELVLVLASQKKI